MMKVVNVTSAVLAAVLLISGAVLGVDFGAYPVVAMVVFVVSFLVS